MLYIQTVSRYSRADVPETYEYHMLFRSTVTCRPASRRFQSTTAFAYVSLSEGARGSFAPRKRQSTPFRPPHDGRVEEVELDSPPGLLVIFSTDHMYRRDAKLHAEVILDAPGPLRTWFKPSDLPMMCRKR